MYLARKLIYIAFFANLFIILFIWWSGFYTSLGLSLSSSALAIARLAGLLLVYAVLMQFLLIGRIGWIEPFFGHDKLARLHSKNGKYIIFPLLLLHVIGIFTAYTLLSKTNVIKQFVDFLSWEDIPNAMIGFTLFLGVIVISYTIVRKRLKYEMWYLPHLLVYLAVIFSFGHQLTWGGDFRQKWETLYWYGIYAFVGGNVLLFRFAKPTWLFITHQFKVEKVIAENKQVTSVYISGKHMDTFSIQSGQFMLIRFLTFANLWNIWQAHPFSLSKAYDGKTIRVTPKNSGDYTATISQLRPGTYVFIDGPHGSFTEKFAQKKKILFIAGGIGITPIRSLIESMAAHKRDVVLLYSNKDKSEMIFDTELRALSQKYKFPYIHFMTQAVYKGMEKGRIDSKKITQLVRDYKDREVYICGPIPMIDSMRKLCEDLGIEKQYVHYEKFEL